MLIDLIWFEIVCQTPYKILKLYKLSEVIFCFVLSACLAVGHSYLYIMPFLLPIWLVLQIFWQTILAFPCTSSNLLTNWSWYHASSMINVSNSCFYVVLGFDDSLRFADGRVRHCSLWSLVAFATLEGWCCFIFSDMSMGVWSFKNPSKTWKALKKLNIYLCLTLTFVSK